MNKWSKLSKKSKIIRITILAFISFFIIRGFIVYRIFHLSALLIGGSDKEFNKKLNSYLPKRFSINSQENNLPDYAKDFIINKKEIGELNGSTMLLSEWNSWNKEKKYDSVYRKELYLQIEKDINKMKINNIEDFSKILIPKIKEKIKSPKTTTLTSYKDSDKLPSGPNIILLRVLKDYWCIISRYLENKKKYDDALLLSHALNYVANDLQRNYCSSLGYKTTMTIIYMLYNMASESIMFWANEPHPQCKELAKIVANDILDFVDNSYPLSFMYQYEYDEKKDLMEAILKTIGYGMISGVNYSSYKKRFDYFYKSPLSYAENPLYEIKNLLEQRKKTLNDDYNKFEPVLLKQPIKSFFFTSSVIPEMFLFYTYDNQYNLKESYEAHLAKMEMAAIALAINSYFSDKNRLPTSMADLSEWFGRKLPNNRLTGKPYELDFKEKFVLYNEGPDYKPNTYDDFFFKF